MLNSLLEEQPATNKLALCLLAGGLISAGAAAVCWVCGLDPAGGASLSADTLRAAAVGGAAAAPLVALKALLWSEWARQQLPFLDDIHKAQVDAFKPVMANLNAAQTVLLLASGARPWAGGKRGLGRTQACSYNAPAPATCRSCGCEGNSVGPRGFNRMQRAAGAAGVTSLWGAERLSSTAHPPHTAPPSPAPSSPQRWCLAC
jgi:hypothetical protein